MIKIEYFIKCFDCGELRPAEPVTKGKITLYTCMCEKCCSITRSSKPDVTRI